MNVASNNVIAALTRLATLKLIIVESPLPFFYPQTKISINVPIEDVKYALKKDD